MTLPTPTGATYPQHSWFEGSALVMTDGRTQWEREQRRLAREIEQQQRAEERARIAAEKERQRQYAAARKAAAEEKTAQLARTVEELETILRTGLRRPGRLDVTSLYRTPRAPELKLGALASPIPEPEFVPPPIPGALSRLFGGQKRFELDFATAQQRYQEQLVVAQRAERERQRQVVAKQQDSLLRSWSMSFPRRSKISRFRVSQTSLTAPGESRW